MQKIANLECLIAGATPSRSRIVLLHGRGASAQDLFSLGDYLPPRAQGIFPQGPLPFPAQPFPMGWAWYDLPPNDRAGVLSSAEKLTAFLDEIVKGDPARARTTILGGFSQGAVMTLEVGLRYRPLLGGLVVMSGYLMDEARAFDFADGVTPPVCMVHGTADEVIAVERGRKARDVLTGRDVGLRYQEFMMGHEITGESWAFVSGFLEDILSP